METSVDDYLFFEDVHRLYLEVTVQNGPPESPLAAIVRPDEDDHTAVQFDLAIHRVVRRINSILGPSYMSLQYEGQHKWTLMGSERAEWIEFVIVGRKTFKVTKFLRGVCCVKSSFRSDVLDMETDISSAFRMMANHSMKKSES
jgi:hypothetical protein